MSAKFKVEVVDRSGQRHYTRTIRVPKLFTGNLESYLRHRIYLLLAGCAKYRCSENAFWKEWTLLQYFRDD